MPGRSRSGNRAPWRGWAAPSNSSCSIGELQGLLARVSPVCVDEQLDVGADGLAGAANALGVVLGMGANLHLHLRDSLGCPAGQLVGETPVGVSGKAARPVDRHPIVG